MPDSGLSGQYGSIPYNIFKEKYEVTAMNENPNSVNEFMRESLRDLSCSATFFESDHKREDNHSEEFLSLRHTGHRSGEVPDAPDLFLELTDRDPRGTALDPNFRLLQDHSWSRKDYFRFTDDGDNSVTEREKRPQQLIAQIRDQFENVKARMKWFSTSKDNFAAAGNYNASATSRGATLDLEANHTASKRAELTSTAKANFTTAMSNNWPLGWEQTGDHEFKVAAYGQLRTGQAVGQDAELNRVDQDYEQSNLTIFQDQVVTTGVASLMKSIVEEKNTRMQLGDTDYRVSAAMTPSEYRFFTDPKNGKTESFVGTQKEAAEFKMASRFIGQLQRQSGTAGQDIETQLQIVTFMDNATKAPNTAEARLKWEDQVMSAKSKENFEGYNTANKVMQIITDIQTNKRNISETAKRFDSMQTARLGTAKMTVVGDQLGKTIIGEGYKQQSRETFAQTGQAPKKRDAHNNDETQQHNTLGVKDRTTKGVGGKYTREFMETDRTLNAIAEAN